MKRTHLSLLMEDFGENESRLLENAIDIDASHDGMASTCKARVQCFFADACRQVPYSELGKVTGDGRVLVDEDLATNLAEEAPRFYATLPADPAYGQSGRPTLFTLAVLDALRGTGAGIVRGKWVVKVGTLQRGIAVALERRRKMTEAPPQAARQGGEMIGQAILHELAGLPFVPLTVEVEPEIFAIQAEFYMNSVADPAVHHERAPANGPWELDVPAGDYRGGLRFVAGAHQEHAWQGTVYPPECQLLWAVG